ncbi:MAG: TfuA-like protein [Geminicoccaceae bacterium]
MTACVFLGPTMPVDLAHRILTASYLPPVRQGDIYRAIKRFRPRMIGIADGYFHQVPPVWHKENLCAMAKGVHVLGSASMGALRAAELQAFHMEGVGKSKVVSLHRLYDADPAAMPPTSRPSRSTRLKGRVRAKPATFTC